MKIYNKAFLSICAIAASTLFFTMNASAQKYKTAADTTELNKEYAQVTLDLSRLNVQLLDAKNKTAAYQSKSAAAAQDASSAAEKSKADASVATNGDLGDAKKAMKQAKRANNDAKDADNAKQDQADNLKDINKLNDKIAKKQQKLADLDKQRQAILAAVPAPPAQ